MAEPPLKSKLKRRKFSLEETSFPLKDSRREAPPPGAAGSASSGTQNGSPLPATARWSPLQPPPAAQSLWALALTHLEGLQGGLVPDLPPPSAAKPSSDLDGWRWCDPCEEVNPFPQSSSPSLIPSSLSFIQQDPPSKPARPSSSSFTHHSASLPTETAAPLLSSQRASPPRGAEGRPADRNQQGSAEEEDQRNGGKGELQSCPMCLQEFPSGFSQMDCDSHLARCLSDMNVDVTW